jgi:hypothetical protein
MGYYPVNTGINAILVTIFLLIEVSDLRSYSVVVEMITVGTPGLGVPTVDENNGSIKPKL